MKITLSSVKNQSVSEENLIILDPSFFFFFFFFRVAQTCKKESFFVYADDTDSMNDDMK